MRRFFQNMLHRLLGAGNYIVINPAVYEALQSTLVETKGGVSQIQHQLSETQNMLSETKGGVSQLLQQVGDTLSHMVVLRHEISDARERLAETKSGVSQTQAQVGETLSHVTALRRDIANERERPAGTTSGASRAQSRHGECVSEMIPQGDPPGYGVARARSDGLRDLPLQLDLAASACFTADMAASDGFDESNALAEHYARLANLVSRHWVAGGESPADSYPDDDMSPDYATTVIGDPAADGPRDDEDLPSLPWRQLWTDRDCGVLLVLGQANAANHGEARHAPLREVFSLDFRNMRCRPAADPLAGASGAGDSIWSRLSDLLIETGAFRRVLLVPLTCGESSIKDWTPKGTMHPRTTLALSRLRKELDVSVLPFSAVLWQQGETDANQTQMSARAYKMHFHDVVADLRANGVFAPVFAACATFCEAGTPAFQNRTAIRQALLELPDPTGGIFGGPDTDTIGPEGRSDGCHFSEHGLQRCAELWLDTLSARRHLLRKLVTGRLSDELTQQ